MLEKIFRTLLDNTSELIIYEDTEGKILWANPTAYHSLGKAPGSLEGKYCFEVWHQRNDRCPDCPASEAIKTLKPAFGKITSPDGRHWEVKIIPQIENGEITGLIEITENITSQEQAKEKLRQSEEKYRRLAESAQAILWEYDIIRDRWTYVAPQAEEILGFSPQEWTNLDFWINRLHPADRRWAVNYCMECTSRGEEHTFEYRFVKKDGSIAWLRDVVSVEMEKDRPVKIRGFMIDITNRKNAEEALGENREFLSQTLQSIGDGVIVTDPRGNISQMNPVAEKLTGWELKHARGKSLSSIFKLFHSETGEKLPDPVEAVLQTGKIQDLSDDTTLLSRSGEKIQIADSAAPIRDDEDNILGVIIVFSDVTEKYQAREKLRRSREFVQSTIDALDNNICVLNEKGEIIYTNKRWLEFARENNADLSKVKPGVNYLEICEKSRGEDRKTALQFARGIRAVRDGKDSSFALEYPCHSPKKERWFLGRVTSILPKRGEKREVVISHQDITERKKAEKHLRYLSFHDTLTGLYNRNFFEEEIQRIDVERQLPISIIMADLNGLKLVNDTFGHQEGDQLLKDLAGVIKRSCRSEDIIARWGGDEFVILLPKTPRENAENISERILKNCQHASIDKKIPISVALGVATRDSKEKDFFSILKIAEDRMYKNKLAEGRNAKGAVLTALIKTLGTNTHETKEHVKRLQKLAHSLGTGIGLPSYDLDRLSLLASLHDIGKIAVPENILNKPGPLTPDEWEIIKEHPENGYRIVSSTEEFSHVATEVLSHHERWDGTGYPRGLSGKDIPVLARLFAIVDAYEAMTAPRPYKEPVSSEKAVSELNKQAGSQFDPMFVEVFAKLFEEGKIE